MVDDDDVALFGFGVVGLNCLVFFVDDSDELQSYVVLEVDCEVGEKEDAFFDDFDVCFQDEVLFDCGIYVLQKIHFLILFQPHTLILATVFLLNIFFHFQA